MNDYYSILELHPQATIDEIKKSYRRLAFQFHPDICKASNASQKFIAITEAYEILSDSEKRKIYDALRSGKKDNKSSTKFEEYRQQAQQKADKYAHIDISKFKQDVLDNLQEVYIATKKGAKLGCGIYGGLTFFGAGIFGIYKWIEYWLKVGQGEKDIEFWPIISITWILLFVWLGFTSLKELLEK